MSIRCGHCGDSHDTVDDVRACADERPYAEERPSDPEPSWSGPMHCDRKMIPIVYGYPSGGMHEAAANGEMRLGGCMVGAFSPDWECATCGHVLFNSAGHHAGGLAHVNIGAGVDWSKVPDPPWWTKVRMRLQYWITGDV